MPVIDIANLSLSTVMIGVVVYMLHSAAELRAAESKRTTDMAKLLAANVKALGDIATSLHETSTILRVLAASPAIQRPQNPPTIRT